VWERAVEIYRKYYGTKMMLFILATFFYASMAAGFLIGLIFGGSGIIPAGCTPRRYGLPCS
jgi:uncharacterized protein